LKRYWKLFILILVVIVAISTFYLKPLFSNSEYPDFTIKPIKGEPTEINGLTLQGSYSPHFKLQSEFGYRYYEKAFSLDSNDIHYDNQNSFFNQLSTLDYDSSISRLLAEHKKFLRGKTLQPQNFFEDDSFLIYIDLEQDYLEKTSSQRFFSISMLNKKTNEPLSYKIEIPTKKAYQFVEIQKIQIINNNLIVITRNDFSQINQEEDQQEFHVYQLDLGNQKVTQDNLISFKTNSSTDYLTRIELLSETKIDQLSDDLIFSLYYDQPFNEGNESPSLDSDPGTLRYELFRYTISKNETDEITLPKEFNTLNSIVTADKKTIYSYLFTNENKFEFYRTSLVNLDQSSEQSIILDVSEDSIEWYNIKNNKLYLVAAVKSSRLKKQLFIYNLTNESLVYQGIIEPTSDTIETNKNGLMIDYGLID
jgi:hypothetical protein